MGGADLIITITERSLQEAFTEWFQAKNIPLVLATYGRGTATTEILDCLGLEDTEKAVLFCVSARSAQLVHQAAKDLWLDVPGRGILIAVPISSIGGSAARDFLLQQEEAVKQMDRELTHELIVVITNEGYTDRVMDLARAAGATGGTSIHAKGTGTDKDQKFFGVSIAAEKEVIFILTRTETRNAIMKAIMNNAGLQSEAKSLVFSAPVSAMAGLRKLEND